MSHTGGDPVQTESNTERFDFQPLDRREARGSFDGGALLPGEVEAKMGIIGRFAGCFTDHRDPELIEHPVDHLIAQRVFGLALGVESVLPTPRLNEHNAARSD